MTTARTDLPDALERNRADEQRRALRALLARPLIAADEPAFALVRRHAGWLHDWLGRETGWPLQIESDFARLHKRPADTADATRPARSGSGANAVSLNRRRYALVCLLLAELERSDLQITLGRLGEALVNAAAEPALAEAGLRFALESRGERRDLVVAVRLLLETGVLARVAGEEEAFIQRGPESDVLYDINRRLLAALLVTARGPSLVELAGPLPDIRARLAAIRQTFVADTPDARNRERRHRLTRRLLDDPVVYFDDLDAEEHAYLASQRAAIVRRIEEATGLVAEIRAEGIAMADPRGELTDERMPSEGTEGHAALLVAEHLAALGADASATHETLAERMRAWREEHRAHWRKGAREPGAEHDLAEQAVARLEALRLVARDGERIRPLPALGRFAVGAPEVVGAQRETEL